jgi:hypothetical protein
MSTNFQVRRRGITSWAPVSLSDFAVAFALLAIAVAIILIGWGFDSAASMVEVPSPGLAP